MKTQSLTASLVFVFVWLNQATAQEPYLSPPIPWGYPGPEGPHSVLVRPDGSLIVNGSFSFRSGEPHGEIVITNPQGEIIRRLPSQYHIAVAALTDGSMFVVGGSGVGLCHLKKDGSLDADFGAHFGSNAVEFLQRLPDGRSLVRVPLEGGSGTELRRILPSGSSDEAADQAFRERLVAQGLRSETMSGFWVHPDGRILAWTSSLGRERLVRLWPDGTRDQTFQPSDSAMEFLSNARMFPLADGKLYGVLGLNDPVNRPFHSVQTDMVDGVQVRGVIRLNSDGTVDSALKDPFAPKMSGGRIELYQLQAAAVMADGRLAIVFRGFQRLLPDATLDSTFHAQTGGDGRYVVDLVPQSDDRLLVVDASWYPGGLTGIPAHAFSLKRLNPDGSLDPTLEARELERTNPFDHVLFRANNLKLGNYLRYRIETSDDLIHWEARGQIRFWVELDDPQTAAIGFEHYGNQSEVFYRLTESP